ncbi:MULTISPECIES: single-stranded DNA-binding protein [Streptomyces]|uniref:Single-stranded DNA-binding protein n=1 Tax=Streptomyces lonegramiae TaxID=3075524 RepID=A0ABU2XA83_9ACTN|nr:single-stranded DNA-binding protein [Streptomyces sp. DSM 41529]MDT0542035.1 single-stranded DNA-binding protein [Streptomyces sp. DSM 41529]
MNSEEDGRGEVNGEAARLNETWLTVVGNAATRPDYWETAAGVAVARFRLAVTARRWERAREAWTDAYTSFYTVWAWRGLAANVAASVSLGEPLVVHGTLRVRERTGERPPDQRSDRPSDRLSDRPGDGGGGSRRWITADVDAVAVGHDLARGTSAFRRISRAKPLLNAPTGATPP